MQWSHKVASLNYYIALKNCYILIQTSLKFVSKGQFDNESSIGSGNNLALNKRPEPKLTKFHDTIKCY